MHDRVRREATVFSFFFIRRPAASIMPDGLVTLNNLPSASHPTSDLGLEQVCQLPGLEEKPRRSTETIWAASPRPLGLFVQLRAFQESESQAGLEDGHLLS